MSESRLKLPLDLAEDPDAPVECHTLVVDADGEVVADCCVVGRDLAECEAYARLIVERVNAGPAALEPHVHGLASLAGALRSIGQIAESGGSLDEVRTLAGAALGICEGMEGAEATEARERVAQITAHRACTNEQHDPANGKLSGFCVVCGVPWPCKYAGPEPVGAPPAPSTFRPPDLWRIEIDGEPIDDSPDEHEAQHIAAGEQRVLLRDWREAEGDAEYAGPEVEVVPVWIGSPLATPPAPSGAEQLRVVARDVVALLREPRVIGRREKFLVSVRLEEAITAAAPTKETDDGH